MDIIKRITQEFNLKETTSAAVTNAFVSIIYDKTVGAFIKNQNSKVESKIQAFNQQQKESIRAAQAVDAVDDSFAGLSEGTEEIGDDVIEAIYKKNIREEVIGLANTDAGKKVVGKAVKDEYKGQIIDFSDIIFA